MPLHQNEPERESQAESRMTSVAPTDVRRLAMDHLSASSDVDLETVRVEADYSMEFDSEWQGRQGGAVVQVSWVQKQPRGWLDVPNEDGLYPQHRWLEGDELADFINALFR